jgi:hypothetical protein
MDTPFLCLVALPYLAAMHVYALIGWACPGLVDR